MTSHFAHAQSWGRRWPTAGGDMHLQCYFATEHPKTIEVCSYDDFSGLRDRNRFGNGNSW